MRFLVCESEEGGMDSYIVQDLILETLYPCGIYSSNKPAVMELIMDNVKEVQEWSNHAHPGDITEYSLGIVIAVNDDQKLSA